MTGTGLNYPEEGMREAERRDLEAELKEKPLPERGQGEASDEPESNEQHEDEKT
jgi:hypothetical protein